MQKSIKYATSTPETILPRSFLPVSFAFTAPPTCVDGQEKGHGK